MEKTVHFIVFVVGVFYEHVDTFFDSSWGYFNLTVFLSKSVSSLFKQSNRSYRNSFTITERNYEEKILKSIIFYHNSVNFFEKL